MTNKIPYPYLAKQVIKDKTIVVLFSEKNYGTVVYSEIKDDPSYAFGAINEFEERKFEILPEDEQISIHN